MFEIERLQAYLRKVAGQQYRAVSIPPFTAFFHPQESFKYFNYAIPDYPTGAQSSESLAKSLEQLRTVFRQNDRLPRFEYIDEFDPDLGKTLAENGFQEEGRYQLMVCTPNSYRPVEPPAGLMVSRLTSKSSAKDIRDFSLTQQQGFEPDNHAEPTAEEIELKRPGLDSSGSYLVRLDGQAVAAGVYSTPADQLTEVAGIATLDAFRRRGIASYLTSILVREAFAKGVTLAFLSAADARAGRVYERVGFQPFASSWYFSDPA